MAVCLMPDGSEGTMTDLGCVSNNPLQFVGDIYRMGLGILGGVSLLFIIIGGYIILTSQGQPDRLRTGKSFIFYAIAGLLLAIFGFVFVEIVVIDILKIPGFSR